MKYIVSLLILVMLTGITGCSDKSSSPSGPSTNSQNIPTFPQMTFSGPNTSSTDFNVHQAESVAQSLNGYIVLSSTFTAVPAQQNGNTYTWSVNSQGISINLTAIKQNDGSYNWNAILNGTSGSIVYTNFKQYEGTISADGKSGTWIVYMDGVPGKLYEYNFAKSSSNVLTGTIITYDANGGILDKRVLINNPDGSGSLETYSGTQLSTKSVWLPNGSGTWYTYPNNIETLGGNWN